MGSTVTFGNEKCTIPQETAPLSEEAAKKQKKLCAIDLHAATTRVCGKDEGTNATYRVYLSKDDSPAPELAACKKPNVVNANKNLSKKANLKHTLQNGSCSRVPGILAYPAVARLLGLEWPRVPEAVIRTMDAKAHTEIGRLALSIVRPDSMLSRSYKDILRNPDAEPVLALVEHLKDVDKHDAMDTFTEVTKSAAYRALIRGKEPSDTSAQATAERLDLAHMFILDVVMGQRDRFSGGNIGVTEQDGIKRLVLEDNDCALFRPHELAAKAVGKLRHLDQKTYDSVMALEMAWNDEATRNAFADEHLLSTKQMQLLRDNLAWLAKTLRTRHDKGQLTLDL